MVRGTERYADFAIHHLARKGEDVWHSSPRRLVVIRGKSQQFGERSLDGSSSHLDPELPTLGEGGTPLPAAIYSWWRYHFVNHCT